MATPEEQMAAMTAAMERMTLENQALKQQCAEMKQMAQTLQGQQGPVASQGQPPVQTPVQPSPGQAPTPLQTPVAPVLTAFTAKPNKPSQFKGKGQRADTWLFQMECYFDVLGQPKDNPQAMAFAASFFEDSAAVWWQYVNEAVLSGGREAIKCWQDFRLALLTEFQSLDVQRAAREQLDNLRQQGPVIEYIRRVRELALQISTMSPDDLLHRFLKGLKPAVRTQVELHYPANFNDAARMAERSDAVLFSASQAERRQARQNAQGNRMDMNAVQETETRACFYCKQRGHLKRNCPQLKASRQ